MSIEGHKIDFEAYLIDRHAEQYTSLDDEMPDDCSEWIAELDVDTLIEYANKWAMTLLAREPRPRKRRDK
jgi:hypothetical protein